MASIAEPQGCEANGDVTGEKCHDPKLVLEAKTLTPILARWKGRYENNEINDVDFVAIYILASLAVRYPGCRFLAGPLNPVIDFDCSLLRKDCKSLAHFPELLALLNNKKKLVKYFGESFGDMKVVEIFSKMRLKGIKKHSNNYVNHSIVKWGIGKRPLLLKFYIPSPMKVLKMQANSTRVVTMFVKYEQLIEKHAAPLTYMSGSVVHERDPLHFLIHDLQHIEKFCDPMTNLEQVGFFKKMLSLGNNQPNHFFRKYDDKRDQNVKDGVINLWQMMEYVISDMNTWSTHLIKYVRAKWMIYMENDVHLFHKGWDELMIDHFGIPKNSPLYHAMINVCDKNFTREDGEMVREYFINAARGGNESAS